MNSSSGIIECHILRSTQMPSIHIIIPDYKAHRLIKNYMNWNFFLHISTIFHISTKNCGNGRSKKINKILYPQFSINECKSTQPGGQRKSFTNNLCRKFKLFSLKSLIVLQILGALFVDRFCRRRLPNRDSVKNHQFISNHFFDHFLLIQLSPLLVRLVPLTARLRRLQAARSNATTYFLIFKVIFLCAHCCSNFAFSTGRFQTQDKVFKENLRLIMANFLLMQLRS